MKMIAAMQARSGTVRGAPPRAGMAAGGAGAGCAATAGRAADGRPGWSWAGIIPPPSQPEVPEYPLRTEQGLGGGRLVEAVQPSADLVGGGLVELAEDGPGLPPGVAGRAEVAGVAVQPAEVGEGAGLAVAVAELPEQRQRPLLAVRSPGVVAELVVGVSRGMTRCAAWSARLPSCWCRASACPQNASACRWSPSRPWYQPTSVSALACPTWSPAAWNSSRAAARGASASASRPWSP